MTTTAATLALGAALTVAVVVSTSFLDADSLQHLQSGRFLQESNETGGIVFLSEALDEFFRELFGDSSAAYDIMAAVSIVLGLVYAFFGAKLEKSTAFLAGFLVGAIAAVFILEATGAYNQVANVVYVSIVLASGLFVAVISFCIATLRKLIFGAALAGLFMSFVIYLGFGELVGNNIVVLVIALVLGLIFIFLGFKAAGVIALLLSSLLGGALVIVGISHYTKSVVSIYTISTDPSAFLRCTTEDCLIPMIVGCIITLLGLLFQTRRYRKKKKKDKASKESEQLLTEMREYRQNVEARFAELDRKHQQELQQVAAVTMDRNESIKTLQRTVEQQQQLQQQALNTVERKLSAQERALQEEKERAALAEAEARKERELREAAQAETARLSTNKKDNDEEEKEELLQQLAAEKEELEAQLAAERAKEVELQKEELEREQKEKDKENRETDLIHGATLISLQNEIEDTNKRIRDFEAQIKEATQLEKRIRAPKTPSGNEEDEDAHPVVQEVRERAVEFAKFKALVTKAKTEQKQSLKQAKKALGQVQSLSKDVEKARRKTANRALTDEDIELQQRQVDELTLRMERARNLVSRYEEYSEQYQTLVQDLLAAVDQFKAAEKRLEAYDDYDLRLNVQEGIALDQDDLEEKEEEVVRAEDILEGRVIRQPRGPNGEVRILDDEQVDFAFLLSEFGKYMRKKFFPKRG